MGTYREAVADFLNGSDTALYGVTAPTITLHEHFGALKYGMGYNTEQEITENLRVFGRFGWSEGSTSPTPTQKWTRRRSLAPTTPGHAGAAGGQGGLGLCFERHQTRPPELSQTGRPGLLLGDGNLNYGREDIVEGYYTWHFWRGMFYSLDVQHIANLATTAIAGRLGSGQCARTWTSNEHCAFAAN